MTAFCLWVIEAVLEAALACGFTLEKAVGLYRAIAHYTGGELLIRHPPYQARALAALQPRTRPRLCALADRRPALTSRDTHRAGLQALEGFFQSPGRSGPQVPAAPV